LLLSSRQLNSSFTDNSLISFWENLLVVDEGISISLFASIIDISFGWLLVKTVNDVLSDGTGEKNRLLLHDSHVRFVAYWVELFQILVTVCDISTIWIVKSLNELNDCRLSTSTRAYEGDCLIFSDLNSNFFDDLNISLCRVVELDVLQRDRSIIE
jgi:hypothetical protein